jgi:hypothetical protein
VNIAFTIADFRKYIGLFIVVKEKEKLVIPALLHFELDDPGSMSVMAMLRQLTLWPSLDLR